MQITHEEARRLIQFNADEALNAQNGAILSAHLQDCDECRLYAKELKNVESILLPLMRRHWNVQPVPLSISALLSNKISTKRSSAILTTRMAMIGLAFAAFMLTIWQFALPGTGLGNPTVFSVPPVPTPSTQSTSTKIMFQNCETATYEVQKGETLQDIAEQFGIAKEEIMAANHLKTEAVTASSMKLLIPLCNSTPTVTINPATLTITYIPLTDPIPSTPGG